MTIDKETEVMIENKRRERIASNNALVACFSRSEIEAVVGQVWDTEELQRDFTVESFLAPFVQVTRKADGQRGTLEFGHHPRLYWGFLPDDQAKASSS